MTGRLGRALVALGLFAILAAACGGAGPVGASPSVAACFPVSGPCSEEAKALNGAGASFPAVIYSKWIHEYEKVTGVKVNYQSIGSGGGIKSITDATVDFGATDGPMTDTQLKAAKGPLFHVPTVMGAVVPMYNLTGVTQTLKFTPEALAGIFLGEITKWNDPKIAEPNAGVTLPDQPITVVHRSDGSGTTYIWVDYLSKVNTKWKDTVGVGTSVNWPVGLGAKGNEGVANTVKQQANSIGYVELIYAIQQKLPAGHVQNPASKQFIEPKLDTVSAAASGITLAPDLRVSVTNSMNPTAYPVSGFTWLLVYENMDDKAKALALTRYLWFVTHDAQKFAADLGYAPLPADVVKRAEEMIRSVKSGGTAVFPKG